MEDFDAFVEHVSRELRAQLRGANGETAWTAAQAFYHAVNWRARAAQVARGDAPPC